MRKQSGPGVKTPGPLAFVPLAYPSLLPLSASIHVAASLQGTERLRYTPSGKYSSHLAHGVAQVGFAIFKRAYGFLH